VAATSVPPGRVVVLDPGHNGGNASHPDIINAPVPAGNGTTKPCNTTGTATNAGYAEHAFNWDVALRVRSILRGQGITVVLTRQNDTGVGPCVDKRAQIGNAEHATVVVSIHGDGSWSGHGFHVITARKDLGTPAVDAASSQLAHDVHAQMLADSGMTTATYIGSDGYDQRSDLAGLNLSDRPTILVECGNMRDAGDAAIMSSVDGRSRIATAIASGISAFLDGR
jgi:N-acetylmuramoyl-L-alanine amidase